MLDKRDKAIVCEINPANQVHRAFDDDTKRFWRSVKLLPYSGAHLSNKRGSKQINFLICVTFSLWGTVRYILYD